VGTIGGSTTITTNNLPAHNHPININDPGHNHVTPVNPVHSHTITDIGHSHTELVRQPILVGFSVAVIPVSFNNSTFNQQTSTNTTGISILSSTTGVSVNNNTTGITATSQNTGGGQPYNPPFLTLVYIIRIQ
jgi:hypothetical protein